MLEIKVNRGNSELSMSGSLYEIEAELLVAINAVYSAVEESNKNAADLFKRSVCRIINDPNDTPFANRDDEADTTPPKKPFWRVGLYKRGKS